MELAERGVERARRTGRVGRLLLAELAWTHERGDQVYARRLLALVASE